MEWMSADFFTALASIVVIDLVLAGDNAIVIALAARSVPAHLRTRAIVWGTVGAVAVRSLLTMVVVWLLAVPGLLLAGGTLLVWIAYKLLRPEPEGKEEHGLKAASGFWTALRTIIVADLVMGLDNVLAVAGAAHGSYVLVILGLLVSVPIVVWGSTLILRFVDRYPAIVYLGAGVLAWTAAKMIAAEPLLESFFAEHRLSVPLLTLTIVGGVLAAGFVQNHRRIESRITARLAAFKHQRVVPMIASSLKGEETMEKILLPVDGSRNSMHAARRILNEHMKNSALEVHLLNVQPPFSRYIAKFVGGPNRADYHRMQGEKAVAGVRRMLERANVPHVVHLELGDKAELITGAAQRLRCDRIVMGTARKNSLTRMLEDSTTNRVLEATQVPVEIVAGDAISPVERFGIRAGVGAAIVLLLIAAD